MATDEATIGAAITAGTEELLLATSHGVAVPFEQAEVREMGCEAGGVRAITLNGTGTLTGMTVVRGGGRVIIATTLGAAKVVAVDEVPVQGGGGQGVRMIATHDPVDPAVCVIRAAPADEPAPLLVRASGATMALPSDRLTPVSRGDKAAGADAARGRGALTLRRGSL